MIELALKIMKYLNIFVKYVEMIDEVINIDEAINISLIDAANIFFSNFNQMILIIDLPSGAIFGDKQSNELLKVTIHLFSEIYGRL